MGRRKSKNPGAKPNSESSPSDEKQNTASEGQDKSNSSFPSASDPAPKEQPQGHWGYRPNEYQQKINQAKAEPLSREQTTLNPDAPEFNNMKFNQGLWQTPSGNAPKQHEGQMQIPKSTSGSRSEGQPLDAYGRDPQDGRGWNHGGASGRNSHGSNDSWQVSAAHNSKRSNKIANNRPKYGYYDDSIYYEQKEVKDRNQGQNSQSQHRQTSPRGKENHHREADNSRSKLIPSCVVCLEYYNLEERRPKSLSCGHSVCLSCSHRMIKGGSIGCPECRVSTRARKPDDLSFNITLERVIQNHQSERPSEKYVSLKDVERQTQDIIKSSGIAVHSLIETLENYQETMEAYQSLMKLASESINAESSRVQSIHVRGMHELKELKRTEENLPKSENLSECQQSLKKFKDQRSALGNWCSEETAKARFLQDFLKTGKALLNLTLHLNGNSLPSANQGLLIRAAADPHLTQYHRLVVDCGRVEVHTAEYISDVAGMRVLPVETLKVLVDNSSTLTFLDLGWGGKVQGRVYIRLTGDTIRGRQFHTLCLGNKGHSFKKSRFHRIWWKNLPGEHIWGGDFTQGDGSGGLGWIPTNGELSSATRRLPVKAGLVAGRYEKDNISTIFRIYTRSAQDSEEDAAFGQVEYGLDVVQAAIQQNIARDVFIADCGIIIET